MIGFTLEGYALALIWGALYEQASSDAPKHPDFYKLKRRFLYQLRVEHPTLDLALKTNRLFATFYTMLSARSSAVQESQKTEERASATA